MVKNRQFLLIIFTAVFSTVSIVLDQSVFQIEKIIISKEQKLDSYKNWIEITKQNHIYFDNAKNNLSRDLETQIININQNNAFQSLYPFEDVTVSKDFLLDTFEEYHVYSKYNELNYLMEDNLEKVIKIHQEYEEKIETSKADTLSKVEQLRKYLFEITDIHMRDLIDSETVWIYDGNEINEYRAVRQILIVIAFMMNMLALLCLLHYFKIILYNKYSSKI